MNISTSGKFTREINQCDKLLLSFNMAFIPIDVHIYFDEVFVSICGDTIVSLKNSSTEIHLNNIVKICKDVDGANQTYYLYCNNNSELLPNMEHVPFMLECLETSIKQEC